MQIELGEEEFVYTIKSAGSKKTFSVDYMEFDPKPIEESEDGNVWWRNVGIAWIALGILITGLRYADGGDGLRMSFWFFLGVMFLGIYYAGKTAFTHYSIGRGGQILLIKNDKASSILREIEARRKVRLRETFGKVDPEADAEREIAKFKWLQREGAITSGEASARIQEILAARETESEEPALDVN